MLLALLNDAWNSAKADANAFRDQLVSNQTGLLPLVKAGSISSVGKNSANQSYKGYGPGGITQVQLIEANSYLLALYDQVKAELTCEFTASADFDHAVPENFDFDQPVYDALTRVFNSLITGTTQTLPDITRLRLPACWPQPGYPNPRTW